MTCKQVIRLASRRLDGPLPWFVRLRFRLHLFACKYCARYTCQVDQIHRLAPGYSEYNGEFGRTELSPTARERIKAALLRHRL